MTTTPLLDDSLTNRTPSNSTSSNQQNTSIFSCCFPRAATHQPLNTNQPVFKRRIAIVGSIACGKTSLATRFVKNSFSDLYSPTISDILSKDITYNNRVIQLSIKDSPGRDQYDSFAAGDCVDIHGFVIVFGLNDNKSFHIAQILNEKILKAKGYDVPRILVGSKADLPRIVSSDIPRAVASEWGIPYFETSSKEDVNIVPAFQSIIQEIEDSLTPPTPNPCILL